MSNGQTSVSSPEQARAYGKPIEILVGTDETSFYIHEGIVRASSKFFDNALKPGWVESKERCVRLPEDDPDVFSIYQEWPYSLQIRVGAKEIAELYVVLCKAYCLGEKLMDCNFKDAIINEIIRNTKVVIDGEIYFPGDWAIKLSYEGTTHISHLRKLLVDFLVYEAEGSWLSKGSMDVLPKEYLFDIAIGMTNARDEVPAKAPWKDESQVKALYHSRREEKDSRK
ncbi:uncharacterized protein BDZ99DRAFT_515607 [Mytilinidion resinicola]|uniref:BTB domain-containing protein n=1 Tax=Mytilinidion resinicola TaxID=574789 RepID=A0A6A6Z0Z5_9PEZI|nr:uncharacterized protein BDZ99DRAFT_515607 [Mytilinidion resinicola]KAF2814836.1 hypothetical protein BDZ99DRAFT_515607 [Mytilinidion resinicola]